MRHALEILNTVLQEEQLRLTEVEVAALLRTDQWENEGLWNRAENFGLAVIANLEVRVENFDPDDIDGATEQLISLSAYILWSCAQRRIAKEDSYEATFLALNAAILFLYAANISGAIAIAKEVTTWGESDLVFRSLVRSLLFFNDIPRLSITSRTNTSIKTYYRDALDKKISQEIDLLKSLSQDLNIEEKDFSHAQIALVFRLEQAIPWLSNFLLPDLLDVYIGEPTPYSDHIRANGPFFAFPSQRYALKRLSTNKASNTLITFPTSTGKTLLGECLALYPLLTDRTGVAVYIAPYRAIVTQVAERAKHRAEAADITIVPAMGGYLEGLSEKLSSSRVFLVATVEAFDYALRSQPTLKDRIVSITIDEIHLIEQPGRGTLLECLIGRLRDLQSQSHIHITGLSAVIEQTDRLQQWLNVPNEAVLRTAWTPTRKRFEVQLKKNHTRFYGDPSIRSHSLVVQDLKWDISNGISQIPYQYHKKRHMTPKYKEQYNDAISQIFKGTAKAAARIYSRFKGPVLIVCSSKQDTRTTARELSNFLNPESLSKDAKELESLIRKFYPHHRTLLALLPHRVCYHNSDLEYDVRDQIQKLIEQRFFKVVVATTTLAEGVDLPFRSVIMHRWTHYNQYDKEKRQAFSTLLMRNIIGRSGRAGMFVEGDTIFIDNPVDDQQYQHVETIENHYIWPKPISLSSSLENKNQEEEIHPQVVAQLESALLALINQKISLSEPTRVLRDSLLCGRNESTEYIRFLDTLLEAEVNKPNHPLLVSNSPITLTPLGKVAVETGLSIQTSVKIINHLEIITQPNSKITMGKKWMQHYSLEWNGLFEKVWQTLSDLQEIKREYDGKPTGITKTNFPLFMWAWYSGWSIPAITWLLVEQEKGSDNDMAWLKNPTDVNPLLEDRIAKIRSFCDGYFGQVWSRILRAISSFLTVSEIHGKEQAIINYQDMTPLIQRGVSNTLAAQLLDKTIAQSFPGDRTQAQIVSLWYEKKGVENIFDFKSHKHLLPNVEELCSITLDPEGICTLQPEAANELLSWLRKQ